ncbi:hypothetical protein PMAYCL1PPCAC_21750 [Pristionchus mayeri]|uniref:Uncharacterized protein n=1 Tax=Pristionchus mayeri TaxID=1317129 RepID=A0AAN5I4X3_9BILA|nr:hypothetical protein PMAYCL1PPCAC_21750 [Pristionchus mayeri]
MDFLSRLAFTHLSIDYCDFDENQKFEGKTRLFSVLVNVKLRSVTLDVENPESFIDESFLREYSECTKLPQLVVRLSADISAFLRPNISFAESLSRFGTIELYLLVIDTNWLLPALLNRLREKTPGVWRFLITDRISLGNIKVNLTSDVEVRLR